MKSLTDKNFQYHFCKYLYLIVCIYLTYWIIRRSAFMDFTNDEAYSFLNVYYLRFKMMAGTANTHWLNSFFLFFETHFLGTKEWMLRVHSVITFPILSYFLYKIFANKDNPSSLLIALSVILLNAYFFDFYSLARGYSLSLMFEVIAFYFLLKKPQNATHSFWIYSMLALATFSNYMVYFLLFSYFIIHFFYTIKEKKINRETIHNFLFSTIPMWICSIITIPNLLYIRTQGDLGEGQKNGFIEDAIGVFLNRSYEPNMSMQGAGIVGFLLFGFIVVFYFYHQTKIEAQEKILLMIFLINVLVIEILFFALHIPYCFGRTSLYLNMHLLIIFSLFISKLLQTKFLNFQLSILITQIFLIYFVFHKNMNTTVEWWKSQGIEQCMKDLQQIEKNQTQNKKIGMHLAQYGTYVNYYNLLNHYPFNDTTLAFCENEQGIFDNSTLQDILTQDYILIICPYSSYFDTSQYKVLKHYKDMNSDLLKIYHTK